MQNWKRIIGGCLATGMLALFGCGGGGGSTALATATGKFIDAPVVGLSYVSGNQKGVTGADGSFTYEVGKPVKFTIGGIVLGEAPAKALMTPIDLSTTTGADSTTPDVLARVQLLMSLSSTDPASGTITIPPAILTAAQGKTMNFSSTSTTMQADLQTIVTALAPTMTMVTPGAAQTHFSGTLSKIFIPSMLDGKSATLTYDTGSTTYTFAATGNTLIAAVSSAGTYNGVWSIDTNGRLIITLTSVPVGASYPSIFEIISGSGNTLGVRYAHNDTPTLWEGTGINFTINTATTTPTVFTTAMLAGRTTTNPATWNGAPSINTKVFNSNGTWTQTTALVSSPNNVVATGIGTWSIDSNGKLIYTTTAASYTTSLTPNTFTLVSYTSTALTVGGTDSTGSFTTVFTYVNTTSTPTVFTTAMLAGKKLQQTFTAGTATFSFNTDGTILFSRNTTIETGTWNISQDGILTVNFNVTPAFGLVYSLVTNNGTTLTVNYKETGATGWERTSDIMTFVQ